MPRIPLPDGCLGFADGNRKILADRGPGGFFVNLEDGDPQLKKLRNQDYAAAGLVDAGPEKFAMSTRDGRWCKPCRRVWNRWNAACPKCGRDTVPEAEMPRDLPDGPYRP